MKAIFLAAAAASCIANASGADPQARTNRFGDPFFQVTHGIAGCPEPLGPLATEEEALRDSHHRSERGTRCHLEGRCRHPSSYDYDPKIAANINAAAAKGRLAPRNSTLWVLVQGRRVWIYGCVPASYRRGRLEKALRGIPDVELAMEEVRAGSRGSVPYRAR